jgi:hypothetical protein
MVIKYSAPSNSPKRGRVLACVGILLGLLNIRYSEGRVITPLSLGEG